MDNETQKPLLIPLKVPWCISFLKPEFELTISHSAMICVKFKSDWLPEKLEENQDLEWTSTTMHMRFEVGWTRTGLRWISTQYDWTSVCPQYMLELWDEENHIVTDKIPEFNSRFKQWQQEWVNKKICANSLIYKVNNSRWLSELDLEDRGYHYLFQLEGMTVDIISHLGYWKTEEDEEWNVLEFD